MGDGKTISLGKGGEKSGKVISVVCGQSPKMEYA